MIVLRQTCFDPRYAMDCIVPVKQHSVKIYRAIYDGSTMFLGVGPQSMYKYLKRSPRET